MSKDAPSLHDLPLTQETPATQTSSETFNAFLNAPVTKLDADEYMAQDLDGVTEGLLGSGNLNFLMMQAGQTDEAMTNTNPFDIASSDMTFAPSGLLGGNSFTPVAAMGAQNDLSTDRAFDMPNALDGLSGDGTGAQNNTAGTLGASSAAANSHAMNPLSDSGSFSDVTSGSNGTNGNNGTNGIDGEGGGNQTTINNTTNNNTTETTIIDNTVVEGDTNIEIIDETFLENVENIYNETTDFLTEVVNNVTDIVNNTITNIFDGNPLDIGPIGLNLDAALDDLLGLDLEFINGDQIMTVLDEVVDLSPVTGVVEGLTGDLIADLGLGVLIDPLQYDSSPNDRDVHVGLDILDLGLPAIDVPLDSLEFLLGDIDLGLNIGEDSFGGLLPPLLGDGDNGDTNIGLAGLEPLAPVLDPVMNVVDGLFNPVEDLAGDVDILSNLHVDLLGLGGDSAGPDSDIAIPLDIALIDNPLLSDGLEIGLDPVENIVGDLDLDLGAAADILGAVAPDFADILAGGTGTDNLLSGLNGTLTDTADGILDMEGSAGDTDILLGTGIDAPGAEIIDNAGEILLDPVENILGDIDITGDSGINLLDAGDSAASTDTDLVVDLGGLGDIPEIPVDLGPVESIVGDIDLEVTVSQDVIDTLMNPESLFENITETVDNTLDTAVNLLDSLPASTGGLDLGALLPSSDGGDIGGIIPSWTETLLPDAGSLLGDGLAGGLGDILPDPVAAAPIIPLPIIPVLPTPPAHGGGLLGGLFA